ncbi:MAG: hypothetical protein ACOZFS_04160 [Thermodesulfobacteriota bacterium]
MQLKNQLAKMAGVASMLTIFGMGCASSPSQIQQPAPTGYTRSAVGTADELSPQAPGEAQNIRRVGNQWLCEVNGQTMVYNSATTRWEPKQK